MNPDHEPDDATLVAWLDGELDAGAAARVERAVAEGGPLAARAELLRAARTEMAATLARPDEPAPPPATHRWRGLAMLAVAAASAVVVVVFALTSDTRRDAAASNEWLDLRLVPVQPAWDLFAAIRFELGGTAKTAAAVRIVPRNDGETDEQLTARVAADESFRGMVPVVLDAQLTDPAGRARSEPVRRVEHTFTAQPSRVTVELVDVALRSDAVGPLVAFELRPDGPAEGFRWGLQRVGEPVAGATHGCVPDEPGEYRLVLTLRALSRAGGEPLSVATGFAVKGIAGAWSAPVDGLRARIVAPPGPPRPGAPLPFAVQLRNESDRARCYNVIGATMAPIPTPLHFHLLLDGERCRQHVGTAVPIDPDYTFVPQPAGTTRTVAMLADYWRTGGRPLSELRGRHHVGARFHFVPTLWAGDPRELWQGEVDTPPIEVDFGR